MKVLIFVILLKFALPEEESFKEISNEKRVQASKADDEDFKNWKKVQSKSYTSKNEEENAADNYVRAKRKVEAFFFFFFFFCFN